MSGNQSNKNRRRRPRKNKKPKEVHEPSKVTKIVTSTKPTRVDHAETKAVTTTQYLSNTGRGVLSRNSAKDIVRKSDHAMLKHILAPDSFPPPRIPDMFSLSFASTVVTGNLNHNMALGTTGPYFAHIFSPLMCYSYMSVTLDSAGTWAPGSVNWQKSNWLEKAAATYTHMRYLGYKITISNVTPQIQKGGAHCIFVMKPGVKPSELQHTDTSFLDLCTSRDPTQKLVPVSESAAAVWIANDKNVYNWTLIQDYETQTSASGPVHCYPYYVSQIDPTSVTSIQVPWFVYFCQTTPGALETQFQVTITQYCDFVQLPGAVPTTILKYTTSLLEYEANIRKGNTKCVMPTMPTVQALQSVRPKVSNDVAWYDKIPYLLTGQTLAGTAKSLFKSILPKIPELLGALF